MKNFELSKSELNELRRAHRQAKKHSAPEAYRINAVILLGTGWTLEQTATALLLDEETLRSYVGKYRSGGVTELTTINHSSGREPKLPIEKMAELEEHLKITLYRNTAQITAYVLKKYGVSYSRSGMTNLLKEMGFTYKKPKLVPAGLDPVKQEEFLEMFFNFFESKPDDEVVLFYDSTHPQYCTLSDYGWIKKGEDVSLPCKGERGRVNVSGAIDIETLDVISTFPEKVNAKSTIEILKKIEKKYSAASQIHIILDNASSHHAKIVQDYLADSRINLVFLPTYSPNLNLIERLWGFLRRDVLANNFFEKFSDFKDSIDCFLKGLKSRKKELLSLMTLEFQELGSGFT